MALSRRVHTQNSSRSLAIVPSKGPVSNLRQALDEYESSLSEEQKRDFRSVGKPDAVAAINLTILIDESQNTDSQRCMGTRLTTFLESMQQFSSIVDTFVTSHPEIAALVWGGVRLAVLVSSKFPLVNQGLMFLDCQ